MNRNRTAGHNFEIEVVNAFKKAGFPHVKTSRAENRTRDAEKVDLVNGNEFKNGRLPYNGQCKNTTGPIPYIKLLEEIEPIEGIINVILHKKTEKVNSRFLPRGKFAFLHMKDFFQMVATIEEQKITIANLKATLT